MSVPCMSDVCACGAVVFDSATVSISDPGTVRIIIFLRCTPNRLVEGFLALDVQVHDGGVLLRSRPQTQTNGPIAPWKPPKRYASPEGQEAARSHPYWDCLWPRRHHRL